MAGVYYFHKYVREERKEREEKRERKEEVTGAKEHQAPTGIFIFLFLILLV